MSLNQLITPIGGGIDIKVKTITADGDLFITCDDESQILLKTATQGTVDYVLTTNGDGTVDWKAGGGGGGVTNPLTTTLDCDSNNLINVGTFNTNLNSFIVNTEGAISTLQTDTGTLQTDTTALQTKTQQLTSNVFTSTFSESLVVREFLTVSKQLPTLDSGNCGALFILDGGLGTFSVQKVNGSNIIELLRINTVSKIDMLVPLDMQLTHPLH